MTAFLCVVSVIRVVAVYELVLLAHVVLKPTDLITVPVGYPKAIWLIVTLNLTGLWLHLGDGLDDVAATVGGLPGAVFTGSFDPRETFFGF